jgi:hypothetical protein
MSKARPLLSGQIELATACQQSLTCGTQKSSMCTTLSSSAASKQEIGTQLSHAHAQQSISKWEFLQLVNNIWFHLSVSLNL